MKRNHLANSTVRGANKNVCFALSCGDAQEVFLAGTFNDWNPRATPLQRQADREWRGEVALPPGTHEYQFVVDGHWMPDPQAPESTPNPFGTVNSVVRVAA